MCHYSWSKLLIYYYFQIVINVKLLIMLIIALNVILLIIVINILMKILMDNAYVKMDIMMTIKIIYVRNALLYGRIIILINQFAYYIN